MPFWVKTTAKTLFSPDLTRTGDFFEIQIRNFPFFQKFSRCFSAPGIYFDLFLFCGRWNDPSPSGTALYEIYDGLVHSCFMVGIICIETPDDLRKPVWYFPSAQVSLIFPYILRDIRIWCIHSYCINQKVGKLYEYGIFFYFCTIILDLKFTKWYTFIYCRLFSNQPRPTEKERNQPWQIKVLECGLFPRSWHW